MSYLDDLYNQIPSNLRIALKSIINPSPINEKNFSPKQIETLRNVYMNSRYRLNNPGYQKVLINDANKYISNQKAKDFEISGILGKGIQYPDFQGMQIHSQKQSDDLNSSIINLLKQSFRDPVYSMRTTTGRAYTPIDQNGNVHVVTDYDFDDPALHPERFDKNTKAYMGVREFMRKNSHNMDMDINIGNPNINFTRPAVMYTTPNK